MSNELEEELVQFVRFMKLDLSNQDVSTEEFLARLNFAAHDKFQAVNISGNPRVSDVEIARLLNRLVQDHEFLIKISFPRFQRTGKKLLTHLDLSGTTIGAESASALCLVLKVCTSLTTFALRDAQNRDQWPKVLEMISKTVAFSNIESLDLSGNLLSAEFLESLGESCVRQLHIEACGLGAQLQHDLCEALQRMKLKLINLSQNKELDLEALAERNIQASTLILRSLVASQALGAIHLARQSVEQLTLLDLEGTDLSEVDSLELADLFAPSVVLTKINLRSTKLSADHFRELMGALAKTHCCEELDVSCNNLNAEDLIETECFEEVIPTMKHLQMRDCSLSPDSFFSLVHVLLKDTGALETLDLSKNSAGDNGVSEALSSFIEDCKSTNFRLINVATNSFTEGDVQCIASALRRVSETESPNRKLPEIRLMVPLNEEIQDLKNHVTQALGTDIQASVERIRGNVEQQVMSRAAPSLKGSQQGRQHGPASHQRLGGPAAFDGDGIQHFPGGGGNRRNNRNNNNNAHFFHQYQHHAMQFGMFGAPVMSFGPPPPGMFSAGGSPGTQGTPTTAAPPTAATTNGLDTSATPFVPPHPPGTPTPTTVGTGSWSAQAGTASSAPPRQPFTMGGGSAYQPHTEGGPAW